MRRRLLTLMRRSLALARKLDRAEPWLLRPLPSGLKRRMVRAGLGLLAPLLPRSVEIGGARLAAPRSHLLGYVLSPHEPGTVHLIDQHLQVGHVAVDVGANIGYLTLRMARRVGAGGRVYALEPAPDNLVWLLRNVELNDARQVRVLPVSAGATTGLRPFYLSGSTRHSFYGGGSGESEPEPVLHVSQVRLDDVVDGPVDLVKIDVEGAEMEVLRGMERILSESPGLRLIVEWNPDRLRAAGEPPEALPALLRQRGFEVLHLAGSGRLEPFEPDALGTRGYLNLFASRTGTEEPS